VIKCGKDNQSFQFARANALKNSGGRQAALVVSQGVVHRASLVGLRDKDREDFRKNKSKSLNFEL
jgi:hypothetical protein